MFQPELARGKQIELSQTELYDPSDFSGLSDPSDLSDQSAGSRVLKWFKFAAGVRTTCDCDLEISNTKSKARLLENLSSSCSTAIFRLMDV